MISSQGIRVSMASKSCKISESTMIERCEKEKYVHQGYNCDNCNIEPIIGSRYHCKLCEDFDLCEKCYETQGHDHPLKEFTTSRVHCQIKCVMNSMSRSQKLKIDHKGSMDSQVYSKSSLFQST